MPPNITSNPDRVAALAASERNNPE
eukprot:Gb_04599 [translate_table: standard]